MAFNLRDVCLLSFLDRNNTMKTLVLTDLEGQTDAVNALKDTLTKNKCTHLTQHLVDSMTLKQFLATME